MGTYDLLGFPCCLMCSELQREDRTFLLPVCLEFLSGLWVFVCLFVLFVCFCLFFFFTLVEIIWYVAIVCYPVSITLYSTCASSHSQLLHSPICSQCHCICPCRHYLVFWGVFCWLLNHYWAANLQIMVYRMLIYQKYFMLYSWSHQSGIYICINSLWSYILFHTFFIKNIIFQRDVFFQT